MTTQITPDILLRAYAMGIFPMAEGRSDPVIHWVDPRLRGVFPLDRFHLSRSMRKRLMRADYAVSVDRDFAGVLAGCATRPETWINDEIRDLYLALHAQGHAHSLEVWQNDELVGGVYGVVLGGAFFGESMYSNARDASKIALAWLIHRLHAGGFSLFDTQFLTPHLASLGAIEIPRASYHARLAKALAQAATFEPPDYSPDSGAVSGMLG
jgi:leucyl/phenylalanyl-tRNA---protein transferase